MSKNFDTEWEERDSLENRTFTVRGETFVRKISVAPETLFGYDERLSQVTTEQEAMALADERIRSMLEDVDDGHKRWGELRARTETALSLRDIKELQDWLFLECGGRPTEAPGTSGNGRATSGTPSTARSASAGARG